MPKALERRLKRRAAKKGLRSKRKDAYVYGTLRKTGWKPWRERRAAHRRKGARGRKSTADVLYARR